MVSRHAARARAESKQEARTLNFNWSIYLRIAVRRYHGKYGTQTWICIGPIGFIINFHRLTFIGKPKGERDKGKLVSCPFFWSWRECKMIGLGPLVIVGLVNHPEVYITHRASWTNTCDVYLHPAPGRGFEADLQWALSTAYEQAPGGWTWEKHVRPLLQKRGYQYIGTVKPTHMPKAGPERPYSIL